MIKCVEKRGKTSPTATDDAITVGRGDAVSVASAEPCPVALKVP
jgi:hypothetical protein